MRSISLLLPLLLATACFADPNAGKASSFGSGADQNRVYPDDDGDGYASDSDCNDANSAINPGAPEMCDEIDNDCDGLVDDKDGNKVGRTWMFDGDEDGYGLADSSGNAQYVTACSVDSFDELVENTGGDPDLLVYYVEADYDSEGEILVDCDDSEPTVNPGAEEICDEMDNDCDEEIDEEGTGTTSYYDFDADGYGDDAVTSTECAAPEDYVEMGGDCDDDNAAVNPGATEVCDFMDVDEDCDEMADDADTGGASGTMAWYTDADGDGSGAEGLESVGMSCDGGEWLSLTADDCDDAVATTYPGAAEWCDLVDNDCDGDTDEDAVDQTTWTRDGDSDGYGDSSVSYTSCLSPSGYTEMGDDCDDAVATTYPGADEMMDGVDNDCDGMTDEDAVCSDEIELFTGDGEATSITGMVSSDSSLNGDWLVGVDGVSLSAASLGGDDWSYFVEFSACLGASDYVVFDATFESGLSLGDGAETEIYAWQDGTVLTVSVYDNGDGTFAVMISQ